MIYILIIYNMNTNIIFQIQFYKIKLNLNFIS